MTDICALLPTDYGRMIVPLHDINQTGALAATKKGVHHDSVELLASVLKDRPPGRVVVDAGANIGAFTMGLLPSIDEEGWLHAFEPQAVICNMLAGSVALSQRTNIRVHNVCLSRLSGRIEVPKFRYDQRMNFGSIEFGPEQVEQLDQKRDHTPERKEFVDMRPLDYYGLDRLDVFKIDVQRMEIPVLEGARETIARCKPVLFIEWVGHNLDNLRSAVESHGYRVQREISDDWLCIPS